MKRMPPFRNIRDVFYLVHEEPTKESKNGIYIVKPKDNSYRAIWAVVWGVPIKLMSTTDGYTTEQIDIKLETLKENIEENSDLILFIKKEIESINSTKADREELANVVSGLVPMGSVANLTELEAKPKRNNDAYYVEDQLSPEGNAYIYRWDAGLNLWVNTKQVVFKVKDVITQGLGDSSNKAMSQKAVTDEIAQLAGETDTLSKKIINTKVGSSNLFDSIRGENDTVINESGILITAIDWYTSPPIQWGEETQACINRSRAWAQYDENGNVTSSWYNDTTSSIDQTITKDSLATHFRTSTMNNIKDIIMVNYGDTLLRTEKFYLEITDVGGVPIKTYLSSDERIKEMLLSESFMPSSATYTDGLIDSPFNVIWADGATGQFTLTRNTDNLVTKIIATYSDKIATCNITRDIDGNAINQTITIA